jgi:hypothetical protein
VCNDSGLVIDCDRASNNLTDKNTLQPLSEWKTNSVSDCWNKEISGTFVFEQKKKGFFFLRFVPRLNGMVFKPVDLNSQ